MINKPTVFVHTNDQQIVGALVAAFSMKRGSKSADAFDVKLIRLEQTPHLLKRQGQTYLRKGKQAVWHNEDLQSFSPLRMMVPQLMNYHGRAVVTDPDIFAAGDIYELLTMDMGGKAIMCRNINSGYKGNGNSFYASSVMLLDCGKLAHWRWDHDIGDMFAGRLDYGPWIGLTNEDPATIGELGEEWNSFDKLVTETKLLHLTERSTQPWKTGLPVDFDLNTKTSSPAGIGSLLRSLLGRGKGSSSTSSHYLPHPDRKQEKFFFDLLKEAIEKGEIDEDFIQKRVQAMDVRSDIFDLLYSRSYKPSRRPGKLVSAYGVQ